jgi:hypothetical protein
MGSSGKAPSTPSERLFATYLDAVGLAWEFGPAVGGTRPDFVVEGQVVCEVTAIEGHHLPEQVGARIPAHPIRQKIRDKWGQAEAAKSAGYRFVLVLHQEGWHADLSVPTVAAALFGDISLPMAFDPTSGTMSTGEGFVFGARGMTEPAGNRNLSAVALVRSFNPTLVDLEAARKEEVRGVTDVKEGWQRYVAIEERLTEEGRFDPDASAVRLLLVHSRRPAHPLDAGWFGGSYDEEWGFDDRAEQLVRLHAGPLYHRVPGSGKTG